MDGNNKLIEYKVEEHDREIKEHSIALRKQGGDIIKLTHSLEGLTAQLKNTMNVVKWFIGIMVVQFVGFFFYMIQSLF